MIGLLHRLIPDGLLPRELVAWRIEDPGPPLGALVAGGGLAMPLGTPLVSPLSWVSRAGRRWVRWPGIRDLMPRFVAARGGLRFVQPPDLRPYGWPAGPRRRRRWRSWR